MIKNAVLIAWILIGSLGATYYFSPAAQRARQLSGLGPLLSQIQLARSEHIGNCTCPPEMLKEFKRHSPSGSRY